MSSTLKMEPANRKKKSLSYELKKVLQKKFGGIISHQLINMSDLSYIKALVDMEIEGSSDLLEYLEKHEEIILDEEF
jgi:hypothetical protein